MVCLAGLFHSKLESLVAHLCFKERMSGMWSLDLESKQRSTVCHLYYERGVCGWCVSLETMGQNNVLWSVTSWEKEQEICLSHIHDTHGMIPIMVEHTPFYTTIHSRLNAGIVSWISSLWKIYILSWTSIDPTHLMWFLFYTTKSKRQMQYKYITSQSFAYFLQWAMEHKHCSCYVISKDLMWSAFTWRTFAILVHRIKQVIVWYIFYFKLIYFILQLTQIFTLQIRETKA